MSQSPTSAIITKETDSWHLTLTTIGIVSMIICRREWKGILKSTIHRRDIAARDLAPDSLEEQQEMVEFTVAKAVIVLKSDTLKVFRGCVYSVIHFSEK